MKKAELNFDFFVRLSDPYHIWRSIFGCEPKDTDICEGQNSAAGVAMDTALKGMSEELSGPTIGYPLKKNVEKPSQETIDNIQKKILAGAVLSSGVERCRSNSSEPEYIPNRSKDIQKLAILGDFKSSPSILEYIAPELPDNFLISSSDSLRGSAIRIHHAPGLPTCKINLRPDGQLRSFLSRMLLNTVAAHLLDEVESDQPIQLLEDTIATMPINIRFLEEEEVLRLEAITEFCGKYVDAEGCQLELALRRAPYRKTLLQRLVQRSQDYVSEEMGRYGFKRNGNCLASSFETTRDIGTALYRLTGDEDFHLQGLLTREIISSVDLYLPEIPENFPEVALIPPNDIAIAEYSKSFGPADATLSIWSAADEIPVIADMEPVFEVVPSSVYSIQKSIEKISGIFGFELIEEYETGD